MTGHESTNTATPDATPDGGRAGGATAGYSQIFRVRIADESVPRLLAIRGAAIAEAQRLCPALLRADLVWLEGDEWLDILVWSRRDGEQLLMERAHEMVAAAEMHSLMTEMLGVEVGELVHSTSSDADLPGAQLAGSPTA